MKKLFLFLILFCFISCEFIPESERQNYYTPTIAQIQNNIFKPNGTTWSVSYFDYYSTGTQEHRWQQSKKGSGYKWSFFADFTYSYQKWENYYEYVWSPITVTSYSGDVEIYDGKIVFYGLFGEPRLEKSIQLSEDNKWIKIGDSAYHL